MDVRAHLNEKGIAYGEIEGDLFFRRADGRGMFVREHADGTYDWSINAAPNDTNMMDFRIPERRSLSAAVRRMDEFLSGKALGRLVLDTLGLVERSVASGMSRDLAERAAIVSRDFVVGLHEAGMTAEEIRTRMDEIHNDLKRRRLLAEASGSEHEQL